MSTIAERRSAFRRLHESGCFVIPNPWDAGSARALERLGFKALATTSAGAAFTLAAADGEVARDAMLAHVRAIVDSSDLPVSADYEGGYAHEPEQVAENVRLCVETGVAGLSIEDNSRDPSRPLYDLPLAVERIHAWMTGLGDDPDHDVDELLDGPLRVLRHAARTGQGAAGHVRWY